MQYNINESKTVMVTGATGLVGTKLVNSLKARGYTVIAQYHKQQHFNNTDLIWKQGDILDPVFLEEAIARCGHSYTLCCQRFIQPKTKT